MLKNKAYSIIIKHGLQPIANMMLKKHKLLFLIIMHHLHFHKKLITI